MGGGDVEEKIGIGQTDRSGSSAEGDDSASNLV